MNIDQVYRFLREEAILSRVRGTKDNPLRESGHSFMYRPTMGIERYAGAPHSTEVRRTQREFAKLLGYGDLPPSIMPIPGKLDEAVVEAFRRFPRAKTLVFEGYATDVTANGLHENLLMAARARALGKEVLHPDSAASANWMAKPYFRDRVADLFGLGAIPPGRSFDVGDIDAIVAYAEESFASAGKTAVKVNGTSGSGNCIISHPHELGQLPAFLKAGAASSSWAVVEDWVPWTKSLCCSYFVTGSGDLVPAELCEQVLSPKKAGFLGSCSFNELHPDDRQYIFEQIGFVVEVMARQGLRAFNGTDVLLVEPRPDDALRLPVSRLGLVLIEANPRINGHNQEMLFVSQLATRYGREREDLVHMRVAIHPVPRTSSRAEVRAHFAGVLTGIASPLLSREPRSGEAYFTLDECHGQIDEGYNAIIFVGLRSKEVVKKIKWAKRVLERHGHLKTT